MSIPTSEERDAAGGDLAAATDLAERRHQARQDVKSALAKLAALAVDGAERVIIDSITHELSNHWGRS